MSNMRMIVLVGMLGVTSVSSVSHAQQLARLDPVPGIVPTQQESSATKNVLHQTVSVSLYNVPLHQAISELMRQADAQIMYSHTVVPVNRQVSVAGNNITLADALRDILKGTGIEPRLTRDGKVVLAKGSSTQRAKQGVIVGKVINESTKQPISGATVSVGNGSTTVTTNSDGTFRLTLEAGEQQVQVRAVGFVRTVQKVMVTADTNTEIVVTLDPSASVLNEVVVTGSVVATERRAIGTPITVITAEEIERRGITRIEQFFRGEVPGVIALDRGSEVYAVSSNSFTGSGANNNEVYGGMVSSEIYARGSSSIGNAAPVGFGKPTPLKTFVDGIEILDPSYLGTIDPNTVERIEIITGPQAATIYGSGAMGGVMQIFTKKGAGGAMDATLSLRYGMLENNISSGLTPSHQHTASLNGGTGPAFSYSGNISYRYTGQWQPGLFVRSHGASLGVTHRRGPVGATGSVSLTNGKNGTTVGGLIPASLWIRAGRAVGEFQLANDAVYNTQRVALSSGQTMSFNVDYRPISMLQMTLTAGRSQTNFLNLSEVPKFSDPSDTLYKTGESVGQRTTLGYNISLVPPHAGVFSSTITLGVNGSIGQQTTLQGCTVTKQSTSLVLCVPEIPTSLRAARPLNSESWGGFARWQGGLFDRLYITLGLRGERNPSYGERHRIDWTPTNQIAYTIQYRDLTLKLLGSYGRATRAPDPDYRLEAITNNSNYDPAQYVSRLANPDLTPEYSRGPEGGFEFYYGNVGSLTLNRYSQRITDLIERVYADSVEARRLSDGVMGFIYQLQYLNTASVRQQGWEATGSLNLFRVTLKGTYSWTDSRVLSVNPKQASLSTQPGQSFRGLPTHSANISIGYAHGASSITLVTNWVGSSIQLSSADMVYNRNNWSRLSMYREWVKGYGTYGQFTKPGYAKSDLAVAHRVTPWISATLNITNLASNYGSEVGAWSPTLGRQTLVGVTLRTPRR